MTSSSNKWDFKVSQYDQGLYFLRRDCLFVILVLVVDDIAFASNI